MFDWKNNLNSVFNSVTKWNVLQNLVKIVPSFKTGIWETRFWYVVQTLISIVIDLKGRRHQITRRCKHLFSVIGTSKRRVTIMTELLGRTTQIIITSSISKSCSFFPKALLDIEILMLTWTKHSYKNIWFFHSGVAKRVIRMECDAVSLCWQLPKFLQIVLPYLSELRNKIRIFSALLDCLWGPRCRSG